MEEFEFSVYNPPVTTVEPSDTWTLSQLYTFIHSGLLGDEGDGDHTTLIQNTRIARERLGQNDKDGYKEIKSNFLPSATFGGVFDYRSNNREKLGTIGKKGLLSVSGLVTIDIDHISQTGLSLSHLRERFSNDQELGTRLVFVSPSGDGLKIICSTTGTIKDQESYKAVYNCLRSYITEKYGIVVDKSGSDITRLCLLCHDPDAILKDWDCRFDPSLHPVRTAPAPPPVQGAFPPDSSDDGIEEIVRRVEASGMDIAPTYPEYLPLVYSFTALGERGRNYLHRVCRASTKYKSGDTDKHFTECLKSGSGQSIGYFINQAKSYGINVNDYNNKREGRPFTFSINRDNWTRFQTHGPRNIIPTFDPSAEGQKGKGPSVPQEKDFSSYLIPANLKEIMQKKRSGIEIPIEFTDKDGGTKENLILNSGATTIICGKSSHGKSKMLQNIALYVAQNGEEGDVLYFSYEEDLSSVMCQFANIYCDIPDISFGSKNTPVLREIIAYGDISKVKENYKENIQDKIRDFENLYYSKKLRVFYTDFSSDSLCGLVKYLNTKIRVKAVFIDYMQLLHKENFRGEDNKEFAEICEDIKNTAIEIGIPFVLAAQLNRQATSPSQMSEDNIAESADITRYANTIINLWNSKFDNVGKEYPGSKECIELQSKGFTLGQAGKIYAKLTKNRGGTAYIDTVLDFEGRTGRITMNGQIKDPSQETAQQIFNSVIPPTSHLIEFD